MNYNKLEDFPRDEWGPIFWYVLHSFTQSLTQSNRIEYKNIISQYPLIIPCPTCSYHFADMIKKYPIKTDTYDNLFEWGVNVHNIVNKRLNKKQMTINNAKKLYETQINHKKIIIYLQYLITFINIDDNIYRLNATLITLKSFALILPCLTCRNKINNIKETVNNKNMKQWIQKVINILQNH